MSVSVQLDQRLARRDPVAVFEEQPRHLARDAAGHRHFPARREPADERDRADEPPRRNGYGNRLLRRSGGGSRISQLEHRARVVPDIPCGAGEQDGHEKHGERPHRRHFLEGRIQRLVLLLDLAIGVPELDVLRLGRLRQLSLGLAQCLHFGDIVQDGDEADSPSLSVLAADEIGCRHGDRPLRAVPKPQADRRPGADRLVVDRRQHDVVECLQILAVHENIGDRLAPDLGAVQAQQLGRRRVQDSDAAAGGDGQDPFAHALQHIAVKQGVHRRLRIAPAREGLATRRSSFVRLAAGGRSDVDPPGVERGPHRPVERGQVH